MPQRPLIHCSNRAMRPVAVRRRLGVTGLVAMMMLQSCVGTRRIVPPLANTPPGGASHDKVFVTERNGYRTLVRSASIAQDTLYGMIDLDTQFPRRVSIPVADISLLEVEAISLKRTLQLPVVVLALLFIWGITHMPVVY